MTKKDFQLVADAIKAAADEFGANTVTADANVRKCLVATVGNLANAFATVNPRFDRSRFLKACGLAVKP